MIRINVKDGDDNSTVEYKNSIVNTKISEIKINLSEIETEISEIKSIRHEGGLDRLDTSLLSEEMIPVALADKEVKHLKRQSG